MTRINVCTMSFFVVKLLFEILSCFCDVRIIIGRCQPKLIRAIFSVKFNCNAVSGL